MRIRRCVQLPKLANDFRLLRNTENHSTRERREFRIALPVGVLGS